MWSRVFQTPAYLHHHFKSLDAARKLDPVHDKSTSFGKYNKGSYSFKASTHSFKLHFVAPAKQSTTYRDHFVRPSVALCFCWDNMRSPEVYIYVHITSDECLAWYRTRAIQKVLLCTKYYIISAAYPYLVYSNLFRKVSWTEAQYNQSRDLLSKRNRVVYLDACLRHCQVSLP